MDHPQRSTWVQRLRSIRATRELADVTLRRSLRGLTPTDRRILTEAQVEATRPIVSGVIFSGAVMLAVTGLFEGTGLAPDIGYPWWLVELAALAVAACALATWHLRTWPIRLLMALLGTALTGVFRSIAPRAAMRGWPRAPACSSCCRWSCSACWCGRRRWWRWSA